MELALNLRICLKILTNSVPARALVIPCCVFLSACMLDWDFEPLDTDTNQAADTEGLVGTGVGGGETDPDTHPDTASEHDSEFESDTALDSDTAFESDTPLDSDTASESESNSNNDTATTFDTNSGSDSATSEDTDDLPCPSRLEFLSGPIFTDAAASSNDGGTEFLDPCPEGQIIVGFRGFNDGNYAHGVIGKLQPLCGTPVIYSTDTGCAVRMKDGKALPLRGSIGDVEWERMCPQSSTIMGFGAQTGADVDSLSFRCAPLLISREGSEYRLSRGSSIELEKAGGTGGGVKVETECPKDMVATGVNIRTEDGFPLRAISLGCQKPSLREH